MELALVKEIILTKFYFPRLYIGLMVIFIAYWLYYKLKMCGKLKLYYVHSSYNHYIIDKAAQISKKVYNPSPFLLGGNLQTFYAEIVNRRTKGRHNLEFQRQLVRIEDGGQIALDWVISKDKDENNPIAVIFPGLTGGTDNAYIGYISRSALKAGYRCVILNKRGCSDTPLLVFCN